MNRQVRIHIRVLSSYVTLALDRIGMKLSIRLAKCCSCCWRLERQRNKEVIVPQELTVLITHILRGAKVVKIKIRIRCLNKRISRINKPRCIEYRKISVIIEKGAKQRAKELLQIG